MGDETTDDKENNDHALQLDQLTVESDGDDHPINELSEDSDHDHQDLEEHTAIHVFREHKEPVLKVCLSKSGDFAVTGGQDDVAHVWETSTGKILFSCTGHKDSVHCVGINCKGALVATADMSGLIQVFKVPSGEKIFDYEVDDVHWMQWHPLSPSALLLGTESGSIWILNVMDVNKIKTLQGSAAATTVAKVTSCGSKLMAGYEDGSVRLWDLKQSAILFAVKGKCLLFLQTVFIYFPFTDNLAHKSTVTCIDFQQEDEAIAATGSTDGTVKLINLLTGKVVTSLTCGAAVPAAGGKSANGPAVGSEGHDSEEANSIESVAFSSVLHLLATATVIGVIEVWDVSSFRRRCYFVHEEGVSGIRWDLTDHTKVHSAGLDGCFNTWDGRDGKLVMQRLCHRDQILDFDVIRCGEQDDEVVATSSEDTTCRLFSLNKC